MKVSVTQLYLSNTAHEYSESIMADIVAEVTGIIQSRLEQAWQFGCLNGYRQGVQDMKQNAEEKEAAAAAAAAMDPTATAGTDPAGTVDATGENEEGKETAAAIES